MLGFAPFGTVAFAELPATGTPVTQSGSCAVEWLQGVSSSRVVAVEVLNPASVTALGIVPVEWTAGRRVSSAVTSERLVGIVGARVLPWENTGQIIAVLRSVTVAVEWRSGLRRSLVVDVERLRRVLRSVAPGLEWRSLTPEIAPELIGTYLSASRFGGFSISGSHAMLRYLSGSILSPAALREEVDG